MIITYYKEGVHMGRNSKFPPQLQTSGCSCCSEFLPCTQENLEKAKAEAREWLETLETIQPVPIEEYNED